MSFVEVPADRDDAPVAGTTASGVPVIDVSELARTPMSALTVETPCVAAISAACRKWGFFQIVNHGVPSSLMADFYEQQLGFFALPKETKREVLRTETNSKGWYDDERTKRKVDWKEGFDLGAQDGSLDKPGLDGRNVWPDETAGRGVPGFQRTMRSYFAAMEDLARKLTACMALGLGLPHDHFAPAFDDVHSSYLRLNYYPRCPEPDKHRSISRHTDAGAVTVLTQGPYMVQSLQVYQPEDGLWYEVEPIEDAFIINTGDVMQVWSNDQYKAPEHRVKAQQELVRYSAPFFYNPSYDTD